MHPEPNQYFEQHDISTTPSFTETIQFYLLSIGLLIIFGSFLQQRNLLSGLFVSEILFITAPAASYTFQRHYSFSQTYALIPITMKTAILSGVAAIAAFVLVGVFATLQEVIIPRSSDYLNAWEHVLAEFHQVPLIVTLFLTAVLPGVCEELLFRGFLLQGMRQKLSDTSALILVGVLFGVFHLDPYRLLPVSLLGILFGYLVIRTGSLFTGMIAHTLNNTISIIFSYGAYQAQNGEMLSGIQAEELLTRQTLVSSLIMVAIAIPVLGLSLRALPRVPRPGTAPGECSVESEGLSDEEQVKSDGSDEGNLK